MGKITIRPEDHQAITDACWGKVVRAAALDREIAEGTAFSVKRLGIGAALLLFLVLCPFFLPIYWTLLLTGILIMALFAMNFNLLLGFTGLFSFDQAGMFGAGAYAAALTILKGGFLCGWPRRQFPRWPFFP